MLLLAALLCTLEDRINFGLEVRPILARRCFACHGPDTDGGQADLALHTSHDAAEVINPHGFTIWMAGGGTKPETVYGATDHFGYHAIENPLEIHDLHATMMHLLGVQHESLTINHGGREMRLTDVHGRVVRDLCIS
ncbi:MAG: DUF1501 domain-containing protein [Phycisphaeraceae bacterium]|jgi:hypothetical protein|nr:MAG: DUF1501 domain-containing protein [Phycisphaeraceae bacterium]